LRGRGPGGLKGQIKVFDDLVYDFFQKECLKIMEKDTIKHGMLRMTWTIDPAHGRDSDSRNVPGRRDD
jgi:hypothetical protein